MINLDPGLDGNTLTVSDLSVGFRTRRGVVPAASNISFQVGRGRTMCIIGESGSGKTSVAMALLRLLPPNGEVRGKAELAGVDLLACSQAELEEIRGRRVGVVFQDPSRALNPVLTVGRQIEEVLQRHLGMDSRAARIRAQEILSEVGLSDPAWRLQQYPHELSGGLKQRVMIAIAIACSPELVIADEPTTALDVTVQRQVLRLLRKLCIDRKLALVLITHDFGVVAAIADEVAVMYAGRIVEKSGVVQLFENARHPYTRALLNANPQRLLEQGDSAGMLQPIAGAPPNMLELPAGCRFAPRCTYRVAACEKYPPLVQTEPGHSAACWLTGSA